MNKIKELEGGKKMEEERANGLYWEEIRQTVAGRSAFPEHYMTEVPGGWLR